MAGARGRLSSVSFESNMPRFALDGLAHPIVQAPMAGGPSTVAMTVAACEAGALGFVAAGYLSAEALGDKLVAVRERTAAPFGVNVFAPPTGRADPRSVARYTERLRGEAEAYGVALGEPRHDDDGWQDKLALVRELRVPVVSFTFGCPPADTVARLRQEGIAVWVTVTSPVEAAEAAAAGADALVVQGAEAGGHRGSFRDGLADVGLLALLQLTATETDVPLVASGAIMTGRAIAGCLAAGAAAVQIGTALLLAAEAGTSGPHRRALASSAPTTLTRAFSGRTARAIVNRFVREHDAEAPSAYPDLHHVTSPLRAAGRNADDPEIVNLWAGQAYSLAQQAPTGEIIASLAADARQALEHAARRWA